MVFMPNASFNIPLKSFGGFTTTICICITPLKIIWILAESINRCILFCDKPDTCGNQCDAEHNDKDVGWYYICKENSYPQRNKHWSNQRNAAL